MKLGKGEGLIAAKVVQDPLTAWVVAVTGPGGAKRTPLEEYSVQGRNTQGVQAIGGGDPVVATVITDGEPAGLHVYDANGHRRDIAWRAIPVKKRAHTAEPVIDMLGKVTFAKAIR
jgi:DNA gyrase/topoisomerase IV subunit A